MTNEDLQRRIDASPALQDLRDKLSAELVFRSDPSVEFAPLLVISIISICVQLFIYCNPKKPEELKQSIRDIRSLPPRKLIRLRRRANALWRESCGNAHRNSKDPNPILTVLYEMGETADDATLDELIKIAQEDG